MCAASNECASPQACVVGRCQDPNGVPLIQKKEVRRHLIAPVAMAYVQRGEPATDGAAAPVFTLGRAGVGDGRLYLRFAVPLAKETSILEAYVLLDRSFASQPDPTPIVLHAARVIDPWEPRSISWSFQPRFEEARTPSTRVMPAPRHLVRIDVRAIVQRWAQRDPQDQGIVIMADNSTDVGMAFAMASTVGASLEDGSSLAQASSSSPPRLELYVAPEAADRK
ncbi:DNRLRE domain-containing protein [Pendulispora albinea]|uniref:DNRLRE domain-containing protein n=1 Tax=Pendulispora albinea TaxID=2741071 RepID=A0ABZ2LMJ5_9BACT